MNTSLDPDLLFISEDKWNDPNKRDEFLRHLLDNLFYIDEYLNFKINWSDELEACLWSAPVKQPWQQYCKNQLIPIIYKRLNTNIILRNTNNIGVCNVVPEMLFDFEESIFYSFLRIMHVLIHESGTSYICLSVQNRQNSIHYFSFCCDCYPDELKPIQINKLDDWLNYIDINDYWPQNRNDSYKIDKAIDVYSLKIFSDTNTINNYKISNRFLDDLISSSHNRENIIRSIVKRLNLTQAQAGLDGALKDEFIAQSNQYRFRVSGDARIHYKYSTDNKLIFLRYYPSGHHDDGL